MEYGRERKMSKDGWVEERCLGSGSFGTVMLYENKVTIYILLVSYVIRAVLLGYVPLASQSPYPIMKSILWPNINSILHLSLFWANVIFMIPT